MKLYNVMALVEMSYNVRADSEDDAVAKAEEGEYEEKEELGWNQLMAVSEMGGSEDDTESEDEDG
jgi:hypothetical protein